MGEQAKQRTKYWKKRRGSFLLNKVAQEEIEEYNFNQLLLSGKIRQEKDGK